MHYGLGFLEGLLTFISPCFLPILPVYFAYFAGGAVDEGEQKRAKTLIHALGFMIGFTMVFILLGAFAGSIGWVLREHATIVNLVTGAVMILFGLSFFGVFRLRFFSAFGKKNVMQKTVTFPRSIAFGAIFAGGWTPCMGVFLGAALLRAAYLGNTIGGAIMLLVFSLGLAVPLVVSSFLLERFKGAFAWIRKNQQKINYASGGFLILVGILMMTGLFARFVSGLL